MTGRARPLVLYAVTSPLTADLLLRGQLARVAAAGFDVAIVGSPGERMEKAARREGVPAYGVAMKREIAPFADAMALFRLIRLIRRLRPDLVNASTPKAGLLTLLAARLARVPVRLYTLRGLRLETTRGIKHRLLAAGERAAAAAAHRVVAVSPSLARRFHQLGLCPEDRISVLAAGSSNGVRRAPAGDSEPLRAELGLSPETPVVGFVGRMTRDKGIAELGEAFDRLTDKHPALRLLLVGEFETGDPVAGAAIARLRADPRVVMTGFVADAAPYYRLMDVLAFPSHREGFPNAPLEAAMAAVPVAGFAATGTVDAVIDGATGTLVPVGDTQALARAIATYLESPRLAAAHGEAARHRAERDFRPEAVWDAVVDLYRELLAERGPAARTRRRGTAR